MTQTPEAERSASMVRPALRPRVPRTPGWGRTPAGAHGGPPGREIAGAANQSLLISGDGPWEVTPGPEPGMTAGESARILYGFPHLRDLEVLNLTDFLRTSGERAGRLYGSGIGDL